MYLSNAPLKTLSSKSKLFNQKRFQANNIIHQNFNGLRDNLLEHDVVFPFYSIMRMYITSSREFWLKLYLTYCKIYNRLQGVIMKEVNMCSPHES